ncbi:MAG: hypothetical protein KGL11_06560 [Alphaproteobacteria bacterium]|nr:hypothetical protein [Alphaproteobacteria bacterium]
MLETIATRFLRLARDTRGNVALLLGLILIPLAVAIGAGVDYGRAVEIRSTLQSAVDAAALAGASAYTAPSAQSTATALAQDYVTKGTAAVPSNVTVKSTTVTPGTTGGGNNVAYTMYVSVTVSVPTTFMSFYEKAITVTASATAKNPVVTANFNTGSFVSYACDTNEVYWYVVPAKGGVPDASAMNLLWSNNNANPPSTVTFNVAASAKIGFAIQNVTGARPANLGGCNYGNNMYGSQPGDTQWLYSSLSPPSASYNIAPGGTNTGTHGTYETTQDCALVVEKGTQKSGVWTYPSAPQGSCYTTNGKNENINTYDDDGNMDGVCDGCGKGPTMSQEMTNAATSCSSMSGKSYQYDWNDMGGSFDSYNYGNDMQYAFSCSGGSGSGNGTSTTSVTLTN